MKVVCMIPARLGSTRVKNKNLRIINNKPLIQYIIDSAIRCQKFDEIYINSESETFQTIAEHNNIQFYNRDESLSSDAATNDDFSIDFMNHVECDILIQLLPTSPFISTEEIDDFVDTMLDLEYDTLISVSDVRIESVYMDKPINFDQKKKTPPSQLLEPVRAYACGIMGWRISNFKSNIAEHGAAYHGGDGKIGFFPIKGYSTVDIDNEEDFALAEAIVDSLDKPKSQPKYYSNDSQNLIFDTNRELILVHDGVHQNQMFDFNKERVSIDNIIKSNSTTQSWSHTLINSPSNTACLIAQMPNEGNRRHYHHDWDEWWYIVQGKWEWMVDGKENEIHAGDVVFIERNRVHKITAKGDSMAIRLAVSRADVDHVYTDSDYVKKT